MTRSPLRWSPAAAVSFSSAFQLPLPAPAGSFRNGSEHLPVSQFILSSLCYIAGTEAQRC